MAFPTHIVAAAGYVFDNDGNILLVKTNYRGWECPGGQIENGESVEEGGLREIAEESGIKAGVRRLCGGYSNVGEHLYCDGKTETPTKVIFDFICDCISGTPRPSDETSGVLWVPRDKALSCVTSPAQLYRLKTPSPLRTGSSTPLTCPSPNLSSSPSG
jgi:8-oxo-dGTP diphosphatase